MTKVNQNMTIWSGDDVTPRFTVTGSGGLGEDLTGASFIWVVFNSPTGGSVIRKTTDTVGDFTASGSVVDVNVSGSADTSGLAGDYYHELQVRRAADGKVQTAAVGWVTINRDLVT